MIGRDEKRTPREKERAEPKGVVAYALLAWTCFRAVPYLLLFPVAAVLMPLGLEEKALHGRAGQAFARLAPILPALALLGAAHAVALASRLPPVRRRSAAPLSRGTDYILMMGLGAGIFGAYFLVRAGWTGLAFVVLGTGIAGALCVFDWGLLKRPSSAIRRVDREIARRRARNRRPKAHP